MIGAELKKRLLPVTLGRSIQAMLSLLNTECRRDAIILLRALKDLDESVIKAAAALRALQKSIELSVKRLEAIEQDELLRRARGSEDLRKGS